MSLYLKITVPPWAAPCLRLQARGTARARPVKVSNSEGTPRHAQGSLTIGTGTPSHMTGGPGRACAWAGQAHGTDEARPGQSLMKMYDFNLNNSLMINFIKYVHIACLLNFIITREILQNIKNV